MKLPKLVCPLLLLLSLAGPASAAERFRTDINPALLYFQAFALSPDLSEDERRHLFSTEWRGRALDPRFEQLIVKYDNQFKLVRQAAHARVPCDWGVDLTQGPDALLPGLAKAKNVSQTARLRVRWHLHHGRANDARDDLLAAFVLTRNVAQDGILIEALVEFAMENILASTVAENLFQFSPEILEQLIAGFEASPARRTIQECMAVEKASFFDWYVNKVRELQTETPGGEAGVLAKLHALLARTVGDEGNPDPAFADRVIASAGGSSTGVVARLNELDPIYFELRELLGLPFNQYESASAAFAEKVAKHSNPLVPEFLSAIPKSRAKEFNIQVKMAMVRAAVEYRLHGDAGFRQVPDPCGDGPFRLERLVVEGADRGFMVKSKLNTRGFEEVLVFATDAAPAVYVDGQHAGKPLLQDSSKK